MPAQMCIRDSYNYIHNDSISEIVAAVNQNPDEAYQINKIEIVKAFSKGVFSADPDISDVIISSLNGTVYSYSGDKYINVTPSFDFVHYKAVEEFLNSDETICMIYDDPRCV